MDRPKSTVVIDEFAGLVSNRGRFPRHPGEALVQTNFRVARPGRIESRLVARQITYATSPSPGSDIISMYYHDGATKTILVENSSGNVSKGLKPS